MNILYGGAFDPPTIAHLQIITYLLEKFPKDQLILLPTNNYYQKRKMESGSHRLEMLKILIKDLSETIILSDYELQLEAYHGTYHTLQYYQHPLFVIGADALKDVSKWIRSEDLVRENQFLVFPRNMIDIKKTIEKDLLLSAYASHFHIVEDFNESNISSTAFRNKKIKKLVLPAIWRYIKENKLYEVNSCIRKDF